MLVLPVAGSPSTKTLSTIESPLAISSYEYIDRRLEVHSSPAKLPLSPVKGGRRRVLPHHTSRPARTSITLLVRLMT